MKTLRLLPATLMVLMLSYGFTESSIPATSDHEDISTFVLTEYEVDEELILEFWMTNDSLWEKTSSATTTPNLETEEEDSLAIESWMTDDEKWKLN